MVGNSCYRANSVYKFCIMVLDRLAKANCVDPD